MATVWENGPTRAFDKAPRRWQIPLPVLLYLVATVMPGTVQVGTLLLTFPRAFLVVMFLPLLFRLLSGKSGPIVVTDALFFFYALWIPVALYANNPSQAVTQFGSLVPEFLGAYMLARVYVRTHDVFVAVARWLGIAVCVLLPFAVYEALTGVPPIVMGLGKLPVINGFNNVSIEPRLGLQRVQGVMPHPIHFGLFCATVFSLVFVGLRGLVSDTWRWAVAAAIFACSFLSLSSGAFLALLMQIFFVVWYRSFRRTKVPWLLLFGFAVLCYVAIDLLSNRTPIRVFFSYATFSAHNAYWRGIIFEWGMKNVWDNPLFGIGLNDWVRPWFMYSGSMDNFWLVVAVRYGIPGFLFLATGYALAIWRVGRRKLDGDERMLLLRRSWMFSIISLTFSLCTVHIWTNVHSYVFFIFGAGIWFLWAEPDSGTRNSRLDPNRHAPGAVRYSRFPSKSATAPTQGQ